MKPAIAASEYGSRVVASDASLKARGPPRAMDREPSGSLHETYPAPRRFAAVWPNRILRSSSVKPEADGRRKASPSA